MQSLTSGVPGPVWPPWHSLASITGALTGTFLLIILVDYISILIKRRNLPPGPIPLPLLGNTHLYPNKKPWILMEELSCRYQSPIITFWTGRTPTLWLNDCWSAHELFEKRQKNYCSRPRLVVLGDLIGGHNMVTMPYGERWRLHRKLTHNVTGVHYMRAYRKFQDDESKVAALAMLTSPEHRDRHFERFAASVVSIIATGRRISSIADSLITDVLATATQAGESIVPGKGFPIIMETLPIIAKLPPIPQLFQAAINKGGNLYYEMAQRAAKRSEASFAKQLIDVETPKHQLVPDEIGALVGNLFGAGTDTSSSTISSFVLACCAFPETLTPAWEELDRVVGQERSPQLEDADQLPYVSAFVKEVFRWRPVSVLGGQPHAPLEDDVYQGFRIPKGTSITGNLWAIHRHERDFPQPDRFCPGRFFENNPLHRDFPTEQGHMSFGWGRRVCSGRPLAEQGTWIMTARLLWAFRIESATDPATGKPRKLDIFDYTSGVAIKPRPFDCTFVPRSDAVRETVEREGKRALEDLNQYEMEDER